MDLPAGRHAAIRGTGALPEWKVTPLLAAYKTVGGAAVYIGEAKQQFGPDFYTPPAKP
jgi:hypothetical protein